jgi:predicted  nucleic acid-binding Zn-ribbon protein
MKKAEVLQLNAALETASEKGNLKFKYALLKNIKKIAAEVEALKKLSETANECLKAFNEARQKLIESKLNGRTEIKQTDADFAETLAAIKAMKEGEFKADFETYETQVKKLEEFMNEEIEKPFDFHTVAFENLPDDLTKSEYSQLMDCGIAQEPA